MSKVVVATQIVTKLIEESDSLAVHSDNAVEWNYTSQRSKAFANLKQLPKTKTRKRKHCTLTVTVTVTVPVTAFSVIEAMIIQILR